VELCFLHEYRFSYGLVAVTGVMTGLADAAIDDWAVKAFAWAAVLLLYALVAVYELVVMETPPRPLLQATLFILLTPCGLLSAHHFTWLMLMIMLGKPLHVRLWLAPNIYVDLVAYTVLMAAALAAYVSWLILINMKPCD
jgi:hypothetical protein